MGATYNALPRTLFILCSLNFIGIFLWVSHNSVIAEWLISAPLFFILAIFSWKTISSTAFHCALFLAYF